MDEDLDTLTRDAPVTEVKRLRAGNRASRPHGPRTVLASSTIVGPVAGAGRTGYRGAAMVEIHARLRSLSRIVEQQPDAPVHDKEYDE